MPWGDCTGPWWARGRFFRRGFFGGWGWGRGRGWGWRWRYYDPALDPDYAYPYDVPYYDYYEDRERYEMRKRIDDLITENERLKKKLKELEEEISKR